MFAKYSGTELVGFEEKSTFKNEKVKTFGLILFIIGILSCCISVGLGSIGE